MAVHQPCNFVFPFLQKLSLNLLYVVMIMTIVLCNWWSLLLSISLKYLHMRVWIYTAVESGKIQDCMYLEDVKYSWFIHLKQSIKGAN